MIASQINEIRFENLDRERQVEILNEYLASTYKKELRKFPKNYLEEAQSITSLNFSDKLNTANQIIKEIFVDKTTTTEKTIKAIHDIYTIFIFYYLEDSEQQNSN